MASTTNRAAWFVIALLGGIVMGAGAEPVTLHVAVDGSDQAAGSAQAPFATLERARDRVRARKAAGGLPEGGFEVIVHEGRYELAATFELTGEDAGSETAPIVSGSVPGFRGRLTLVRAWAAPSR